jgi:hypothetical protein
MGINSGSGIFQFTTAQAANRLGVDLSQISIQDGVANFSIGYEKIWVR